MDTQHTAKREVARIRAGAAVEILSGMAGTFDQRPLPAAGSPIGSLQNDKPIGSSRRTLNLSIRRTYLGLRAVGDIYFGERLRARLRLAGVRPGFFMSTRDSRRVTPSDSRSLRCRLAYGSRISSFPP